MLETISIGEERLDREMILDRVGGDIDLLREIIEIFNDDYPGLLQEIRGAAESGDAHRLERAAHSLKGAVANFGAQAAVDAAYRLETMGRKGELTAVLPAVAHLERQFEQLRPDLDRLLA